MRRPRWSSGHLGSIKTAYKRDMMQRCACGAPRGAGRGVTHRRQPAARGRWACAAAALLLLLLAAPAGAASNAEAAGASAYAWRSSKAFGRCGQLRLLAIGDSITKGSVPSKNKNLPYAYITGYELEKALGGCFEVQPTVAGAHHGGRPA